MSKSEMEKTASLPSGPGDCEQVAVGSAAQVSTSQKYAWLGAYFAFNLAVTLFNKVILDVFPFPYLLTSVHALCGVLGCLALRRLGYFPSSLMTRLTDEEEVTLVLFSVLYTVNIAVSNVSLKLVTAPFHQMVRATTPLFAMALNIGLFRTRYPVPTYLALMVVVVGVGLATYGDYYFKPVGFALTLAGAVLAAVKTVVTNRVQTGRLKLSPLELLYRMSPLAFAQTLVYAYLTGELAAVQEGLQWVWYRRYVGDVSTGVLIQFDPSWATLLQLLANGALAFGLNFVSFSANKHTQALTMTVAANVKQVLTIVVAVVLFRLDVSAANAAGIAVTLLGGAWYVKLELDRKQEEEEVPEAEAATLLLPPPVTHKQ